MLVAGERERERERELVGECPKLAMLVAYLVARLPVALKGTSHWLIVDEFHKLHDEMLCLMLFFVLQCDIKIPGTGIRRAG